MEAATPEQRTIVDFATFLVDSASGLVGKDEIRKVIGTEPGHSGLFGFGPDKAALALAAEPKDELMRKVASLADMLSNAFGAALVERNLEDIYTRIEKKYSPVLANQLVLPLIPAGFLEKYRLNYLSKKELEALVLEKTEAYQKLQELDRRQSEFLSIAAHQLRTPLSGLKWALNMLIEGEIGPVSNEQKVLLMKAYEGNERLINLVNDMLQANRIGQGVLPLKMASTQLLDLVDNVLYEMLPSAAKAGVSIRFDRRDDTLPPVMVDPEKIRAVFQNLLENAIKYSRAGGEVVLFASRAGNGVQFSITDHGIGIPADEQALIFSRFFRASNAKHMDPNGTGLGLYIVKNILDMHGGKIWLESGEGTGTTFHFTLGT